MTILQVLAASAAPAHLNPVKLFLDRNIELMIAGNRPSSYANIKVAAKPDGSLVAWQSQSWATGGRC